MKKRSERGFCSGEGCAADELVQGERKTTGVGR